MDAADSPSVDSSTDRRRLHWDRLLGLFENAISFGNEEQQLFAARTLRRRCQFAPDDIVKQAIIILVRLIESTSPRVQESIAVSLNVLAWLNNGCLRAYIGQSGGLAALLRLLQRNPPSEHHTMFAMCLTNLLVFELQNQVTFQRIGGVQAIMNLIPPSSEENKEFLLEILTAALLFEHARQDLQRYDGVSFLIQALSSGSMASRARAADVIGVMAASREVQGLLVRLGAMPLLMDLMRAGDQEAKLVAANSLGIVSVGLEYTRSLTEAGAIPMYAEFLQGENDRARQIAVNVFCIWSAVEQSFIEICTHLVRILRGNNVAAKSAVFIVFRDTTGRRHSIPVLEVTGAVSAILDLVREDEENFGERALKFLVQMSQRKDGRHALADQGGIPVLTDLLRSESEVFRNHAVEALVNFSEDSRFIDGVSHLLDDGHFQTLRREHLQVRDVLRNYRSLRERLVRRYLDNNAL